MLQFKNEMRKQILLYICFLFFNINLLAQSKLIKKNYLDYHLLINKAEKEIFINNNIKSGLNLYNKAFSEYEFVYVDDVANAIQIAYFNKQPIDYYLDKGFRNGLKISHFKKIKLLDSLYVELLNNKDIVNRYNINRKKYLSKIDTNYLNIIYNLGLKDQIDKISYNYDSIITQTTSLLFSYVQSKGFPSNKVIGIDDSLLFEEFGATEKCFAVQKSKYNNLKYKHASGDYRLSNINYYESSDSSLGSSFAIIILIHDVYTYPKYKEELWEQVKLGNLHPREYGMIYDNMYLKKHKVLKPGSVVFRGVYLLNEFVDYDSINYDINVVDRLRKEHYIVPLSVDRKKRYFERKYGFKLFWGFWESL